MPYTFELKLTGLCIFTIEANKSSLTAAHALLVDRAKAKHHKHVPRLAISPFDHLERTSGNPPPYQVAPLPDGSQIALYDLVDQNIEIGTPMSVPNVHASWKPDDQPLEAHPSSNQPADLLDWAMPLQRVNPPTPPPSGSAPYFDLLEKATCHVKMTRGKLSATDFPLERDGSYVQWDFKVPGGQVTASHAMAGAIALVCEDVPDDKVITIKGANDFLVRLRPGPRPDGPPPKIVRASISNLPDAVIKPADPTAPLTHYEHFYDLVQFPGPKPQIQLPHPRGVGITVKDSFCPPSSWVKVTA